MTDYGFWPRLGFYLLAVAAGAVLGAAAYCVLNLIAAPLCFPGGQGPWATVAFIGARVGAIGAAVGGLLVFRP